jgi:hypothetical protein
MARRAAAVVAAVALASAGLGLARLWPELGRQHDRYAAWSEEQVAHAPIRHERLPVVPFDAFRAAITPGSRYYVQVPDGSRQLLTTRGGVFGTVATYWLLPSVPVDDPRKADVVLAYHADPRALGVPLARVIHPAPGVTVAWTARF